MHKVIFYPVGNGDTSQIVLENGKRFLFDFRHLAKTEAGEGPEINLKEQLGNELKSAERDFFDVVAFTHGDDDHISCSTEFFELLHSKTYQGEGRIKIRELWVPAAMILETAPNDKQSTEFIVWRDEARYRLRENKGIRVFSKPEALKDWLDGHGLTIESRRGCITDAGQLVPGISLETDGVEFFSHSPFIKHTDDGDKIRNSAALIFNVRFQVGSAIFDYLAVGDTDWEVLEDIVNATQAHHNEDRLRWDIFDIPHHCSYRALSDVKGDLETEPTPTVRILLEAGQSGAYMISPSNPIIDDQEERERAMPPHPQAKRCYERYLEACDGAKFLVTMEEPNTIKPKPIVLLLDSNGITVERKRQNVGQSLAATVIPRAG